jgi:hypothetical protein
MSVRVEKLGLTGRIFMEFDISVLFENLSRIFRFDENVTRITNTLFEDLRTFMINA